MKRSLFNPSKLKSTVLNVSKKSFQSNKMKTDIIKGPLSILFFVFFAVSGTMASNIHLELSPQANIAFATLEIPTTNEEEIYIKEWMTNDEVWDTPSTIEFQITEEESKLELEIENWMTNDSLVQFNFEKHTMKVEGPMQIEAWMTNSQIWEIKN